MSNRELFSSMDEASARFYRRLFADCMMNTYAVRRGYFPFLLCETDNPKIAMLWRETVPKIGEIIRENNRLEQERMKRGEEEPPLGI